MTATGQKKRLAGMRSEDTWRKRHHRPFTPKPYRLGGRPPRPTIDACGQSDSRPEGRSAASDEQLNFLATMLARTQGELLGTQAALRGVILASPDPSRAAQEVHEQIEALIATGLPRAVDEPLLDGVARAKGRILPTRLDRALRRP